jgi:hypothetical protein
VGALPRPDVAPGPHRELVLALHDLHRRAGWPSLRTLARAAGCSHTTVSSVFSSTRLPAWGLVELLGEAMQGDVAELRALWLAASEGSAARHPPELAGRRPELARVRRHLTSGRGLLLVVGEAGMGKTSLAGAAVELERTQVVVTAGSCLRLSTEVPLLPVADVLRAAISVDGGAWLDAALASCAPYVTGSLQHLLPDLAATGPPPDPSDDWARQRLFAAVEAVLSALAALRATAVLVEDLHWADAATFDLLEHMAARGSTVPLLATWRAADPETPAGARDWLTRVRRLPGVAVLELGPLTRDETADQLARLMTGPVEPATVDRVHARSLGHPLFTEQLAADTSGSEDLPGLLADVLDRRLAHLTPEAWAVARALGVADRPLDVREVGEVTGLDPDAVTAGLRALTVRRLLARAGDREVQLGHPLLAEAVRRSLVWTETLDLHRRLAEALGAAASPSAAEVATHWQAAGDREQELDWRIRAARAAEDRFALANAADQWLRVLELWPVGAASAGSPAVTRWEACRGAIDALDYSAQIPRSVELVEDALSWAPGLPPHEAGELYARAGGYRTYFRDPAAGLPLLDEAIELLAGLPPSAGLLRALTSRAQALGELGRAEEASAAFSAAVEASLALGDPVKHRETSLAKAVDDYERGDRSALQRVAALSTLALPRPDPLGDIETAHAYSELLRLGGAGREQVQAAAQRGLDAAAAWGIDDWTTTNLHFNIAEADWNVGRVTEAASLIDPLTDRPLVGDRSLLYLARTVLDTLRGVPAADSDLASLDEIVPTLRAWFVPCAAQVRLWWHQPEAAFDLLVGDLERRISGRLPQPGRDVVSLLVSAAADVVAGAPRESRDQCRRQLLDVVERLERELGALPSSIEAALDVTTPAHDATYAAERARRADRQTGEAWVVAAREWDRVERPHGAAYCRWRAAEVAVATGQAAAADRLLRRAAQQAREHAPLQEAIAALRAAR